MTEDYLKQLILEKATLIKENEELKKEVERQDEVIYELYGRIDFLETKYT